MAAATWLTNHRYSPECCPPYFAVVFLHSSHSHHLSMSFCETVVMTAVGSFLKIVFTPSIASLSTPGFVRQRCTYPPVRLPPIEGKYSGCVAKSVGGMRR